MTFLRVSQSVNTINITKSVHKVSKVTKHHYQQLHTGWFTGIKDLHTGRSLMYKELHTGFCYWDRELHTGWF